MDSDVSARKGPLSSTGPWLSVDAQCFELGRIMKSFSGKGLFGNKLPWVPPPIPASPHSRLFTVREIEGTA